MAGWEADIFALTYEDRMDIYRSVKSVDEDGISKRGKLAAIESDIPCALSKKDLPVLSGETNNVVASEVVFCKPEIDVREGDILIITRYGKKRKYAVGMPFDYISHREIPVMFTERV